MIRFIDSLTCSSPNSYMDMKLNEFWDTLNPKKKDGNYAQKSICIRLSNLLSKYKYDVVNNNYECKATHNRHIYYLEYLQDNNYMNLRNLILSPPEELYTRIEETLNILLQDDISERNKDTWKVVGLGKLLSEQVFKYDSFRSSNKCNKFYKNLGIDKKHCLYCGDYKLDIVTTSDNQGNKKILTREDKMLFDLDHFYLKSKYPFLSLSFYNLIPCCGICNSRYRGNLEFHTASHINPYLESFDENYIFEFDKFEVTRAIQKSNPVINELKLVIKSTSSRPHDMTARDLSLQDRYIHQLSSINSIFKEVVQNGNRQWNEIEEIICGYEYYRIPIDRKKILDINMAKYKMDFVDMIKKLL